MNTKDRLDNMDVEEKSFSRVKEDKHARNKHSPEKLTSHQRKSKSNDERRNNYPEITEDPLRNRKIISPRDTEKGYNKSNETNHPRAIDIKETSKPQKVEKHNNNNNNQTGSLDSGSEESDGGKKKHKRSKKKDMSSDDDDSHDSHSEVDKKEAKKRRKEEKRLKKEERHKRREERRRKKAEKKKLKSGAANVSSDDNEDVDAVMSDPKKLEIELREKALQSLRAKKGSIGH